MNIVRKSRAVKVERYGLSFEWNDMSGAGFSFPCDRQGMVMLDEMPPEARQNLEKCMHGDYAVSLRGVQDYSYTYREPAQGRCSCGRIIELIDFTNTCECGFEYNSCGQLLVPRNQWIEPWDSD